MTPLASVLVAGSRFGQFYAAGLAASPQWQLAGVLSQGSPRSRALAHQWRVPGWESLSDIPSDVRLACVAVGGAARGMAGVSLAGQLMDRGIDVLIEHPLLPDEWESLMRQSLRQGRRCLMSSFYPGFPLVRQFLALCRTLRQQGHLWHLEARCAVQLSFAALDILSEAVGSAGPWSLDVSPAGFSPLRECRLVLGEVPVALQVLNELTPDHDGHMAMLMRLSALCEGGSLTLLSPHGPLIWEPSVAQPDTTPQGLFSLWPARPQARGLQLYQQHPECPPLTSGGLDTEHTPPAPCSPTCTKQDQPPALQESPTHAPSWTAMQATVWPAVAVAPLSALHGGGPLLAAQQRSLEVAQIWQRLTTGLGFPSPSATGTARPRPAPWSASPHEHIHSGVSA